MSTQKKTAYHHGNLKETLVNAAFDALNETAWENLSLRQLAKQAGVTPTAAYNHFTDKIGLLIEVKTEAFNRFHTYLNNAIEAAAPEDEEQHIIAMARAYLAFSKDSPTLYSLLFSWAPSEDRFTETLATSAASCELLIQNAIANYLKAQGQSFDQYSQSVASFYSWALAHGVSTLISGGNVQAAALCNNFTREFLFDEEEGSARVLGDLFQMLLAGIKHGMPEIKK